MPLKMSLIVDSDQSTNLITHFPKRRQGIQDMTDPKELVKALKTGTTLWPRIFALISE
jgi:hypothetical protein